MAVSVIVGQTAFIFTLSHKVEKAQLQMDLLQQKNAEYESTISDLHSSIAEIGDKFQTYSRIQNSAHKQIQTLQGEIESTKQSHAARTQKIVGVKSENEKLFESDIPDSVIDILNGM